MPISSTVASLPPVIAASMVPVATSSQAWPMLSLAEAQAEATEKLGPRAPVSMAMSPPAPLGMSMGMVNGLTRRGPFSKIVLTASWKARMPPIDE